MDNEEVLRKIEQKLRVGKLDSLLLFLSSSLALIFAFMQYITKEIETLFFFIPLFTLGWIIPIYVGYIKGAISDSPKDRLRGWLYFLLGIGFYITNVSSPYILISLRSLGYESWFVALVWVVALFVEVIFFVICGALINKKICAILNLEISKGIVRMFTFTAITTVVLGFIASVIFFLKQINISTILLFVLFLSIFTINEWKS